MGLQDLDRINPVYRACTDFCKLAEIPFSFKEDLGTYETIIAINEQGDWYIPDNTSTDWDSVNGKVFCPDIIDYSNRIIIEFEEESGPKKPGAKLARKGHGHQGDYSTKRDQKRNDAYEAAGFTVYRLWESTFKNENWRVKLFEFLINCYFQRQCEGDIK